MQNADITEIVRACSAEELQLRRAAIRDAIICMGWIKLLSMFCYMALYLVVGAYSDGTWSTVITSLILIIMPLQVITGLLFFLGAVDIKVLPLKVAIWFCLFVAAVNTTLCVMGFIYFIRTGFKVIHFFIAAYFAILSVAFCSVMCHDVMVTTLFIKLIECPPSPAPDPAALESF